MKDNSSNTENKKLANFTKYVRRQTLARFLAQSEIFKKQLHIKGSIVECGVHNGGGIMTWAKLSSIYEPYNYHRKIIGFDTFEGFPSVSEIDTEDHPNVKPGMFSENYDVFTELSSCIKEYDNNRFLGEIPKVELIKGDANKTIPSFLSKNPHTLISLLYLDFDIYEPTVSALKYFAPVMPSGSIIAFDELNNPDWPGETQALLKELGIKGHKIECFEYEPNISFTVLR